MESVVDALRDVQKLAAQGVLRQGGLLGGATAVIGFRRRREVLRPGLLGGATAVIGFRRRREVVPPDIGTYAEAIGQRSGAAEVGRRSGSSTASSAIREARLVRRLSGSGTACSVRGRGQSVFFDGCSFNRYVIVRVVCFLRVRGRCLPVSLKRFLSAVLNMGTIWRVNFSDRTVKIVWSRPSGTFIVVEIWVFLHIQQRSTK